MASRKDKEEPEVASAPVEQAPAAEEAAAAPAAEEAAAAPAAGLFISEGVRQDLEMWGKATDPVTGAELVLDRGSGDITVTLRT